MQRFQPVDVTSAECRLTATGIVRYLEKMSVVGDVQAVEPDYRDFCFCWKKKKKKKKDSRITGITGLQGFLFLLEEEEKEEER